MVFAALAVSLAVGAGSPERVSPATAERRCPDALPGGARAPEGALAALRREIPARFKTLDPSSYHVDVVASLAQDVHVPGYDRSRALRAARRSGCTAATVRRSWIGVLRFPRARAASLALVVAYVARTPAGWDLWYHWVPGLDTTAFR